MLAIWNCLAARRGRMGHTRLRRSRVLSKMLFNVSTSASVNCIEIHEQTVWSVVMKTELMWMDATLTCVVFWRKLRIRIVWFKLVCLTYRYLTFDVDKIVLTWLGSSVDNTRCFKHLVFAFRFTVLSFPFLNMGTIGFNAIFVTDPILDCWSL